MTPTHQPQPAWKFWSLAIAMAAIVTVMLLSLSGYFHAKVSPTADAKSHPGTPRDTVAVRSLSRPRYETATGSVKPVHESAISSKILARVVAVSVTAGQTVSLDQVLVKLDDAELVARLKQSEAALASAHVLRDQAHTDFARVEQLKAKNVVSQSDYDSAKSTMERTAANAEQAAQAVREAQIMLEYATIRSPIAGTVIDKQIDEGDMVVPGQVLLTLFDPTHMQMVASVRESLALRLKTGQTIPTRLDALDLTCEAVIREIVPEADPATRSFTVKVTGPCPPGAYSGMFGRLLLPLGDEEVLVVPHQAIQHIGQLTLVNVLVDNSPSRRFVRIGRRFGEDVEILAGLQLEEKIVVP